MSRFIIIMLLMCFPNIGVLAENRFTMEKIVLHLLSKQGATLDGNFTRQLKDANDSTCYLRTHTIYLPYHSKRERAEADEVVKEFVEQYVEELPNADAGYCYTNTFNDGVRAEAAYRMSMFYHSGFEPFIIGEEGWSYAMLRRDSRQNPKYRSVDGVEWMYCTKGRKWAVAFRVFKVFGPMLREDNPGYRPQQANAAEEIQKYAEQLGKENRELTQAALRKWYETLSKEPASGNLLYEIKALSDLYDGQDNEMSNAVAATLHDRIEIYLNTFHDCEEQKNLFNVLDRNHYCAVEIITAEKKKYRTSFADLARLNCEFNVFARTWEPLNSVYCQKYGDKAKVFLYQVYLESNKGLDDLKMLFDASEYQ